MRMVWFAGRIVARVVDVQKPRWSRDNDEPGAGLLRVGALDPSLRL